MFVKAFLILAGLAQNGQLAPTDAASEEEVVSTPAPAAALEALAEAEAEPEAAVLTIEDAEDVLEAPAPAPAGLAVARSADLSLPAFAGLRVAAAPGANEVVAKVQRFYVQTKRLTAKFRQTYTNKTFGNKRISDGKLYIKKPGKMRWDYYAKKRRSKKATVEKTFVSDGAMLWAVEHDQKQYAKQDLKKNLLPVAITFLYGKGDLRRDFTASIDRSGTYGKKTDFVLKLVPKKPSAQYTTLYLVVDPGNFRVRQSIVHEASGNTNRFQFFEPDTQKPVKDEWFFFNEKKFKGKYRLVNTKKKKGAP